MSSRSDPLPPDRTRSFATAGGVGVDSAAHTRLKELAESAASTDAAEATPTPFDRPLPAQYQFIRPLGRGGMGEVVLAFDTRLRRHVALKFMLQKAAHSPFARQRFVKEARILAQLDHPNVVKVHEWAEFEGEPYFVMAYLDGHPLNARREEFRTSAGRVVGVIGEIAAGLQHVHENGVYHRDLKASNVVFSDGHPVITDFGCAKYDDGEQSTQGYALLGTPSHMAPEVLEQGSKEHDARADLWSLGVMLYHLLAGELPFAGDPRSGQDRTKLLTEDPAPIRGCAKAVPGVDDRLEAIVRKALAKNPAERYQSAAELAGELEEWATGGDAVLVSRAQPPIPRRWKWIATVVLTGIGLALALWLATLNSSGRDGPSVEQPHSEADVFERVGRGERVELLTNNRTEVLPIRVVSAESNDQIVPTESGLSLSAERVSLFEFLSNPPPIPVTVRVTLQHTGAVGPSRVGLYTQRKEHRTDNWTGHFCLANWVNCRPAQPGMAAGNGVALCHWVWVERGQPGRGFTQLNGPGEILLGATRAAGGPPQVHELVLSVGGDASTATCDGVPYPAPLRAEALTNSLDMLKSFQQRTLDAPAAGDGVGIIVASGTVIVTRFSVEPTR